MTMPAPSTNTTGISPELALRDIHLPDPISWWPLAPGWWILAGIAVFLLVVFFIARKMYLKKALHRTVVTEIDGIKQNYHHNQNQYELIQSLSVLLRRACISFYPRHETASLTGDAWLHYLDTTSPSVSSNTTTFYDGVGEILASAPYMSETSTAKVDSESLITLCETWLLAQPTHNKTTPRAS